MVEEGAAVVLGVGSGGATHMDLRWIEAEAAVQAEIDRDVLDEAAGLAEAELSQLTLIELVRDSVGAFIHARVNGIYESGNYVRGVLTGVHTGASRDWLIIGNNQLVNLDAVTAVRGLRRYAGAGPIHQSPHGSTHSATVQAWLRDRIGMKIAVHGNTAVAVGVLCEVGGNFVSIHQGHTAELIPLKNLGVLVVV